MFKNKLKPLQSITHWIMIAGQNCTRLSMNIIWKISMIALLRKTRNKMMGALKKNFFRNHTSKVSLYIIDTSTWEKSMKRIKKRATMMKTKKKWASSKSICKMLTQRWRPAGGMFPLIWLETSFKRSLCQVKQISSSPSSPIVKKLSIEISKLVLFRTRIRIKN